MTAAATITCVLGRLRDLVAARRLAREQRFINRALTRDGEQEYR